MKKPLFLMCGVPGSGKTTWVRNQIQNTNLRCVHISRDAIRFKKLKDGEKYFSHENEVFREFCRDIQSAINSNEVDAIFVDATHISEASRNKTLNELNLNNVEIYAVDFSLPLQTCLNQNELRKEDLRAYVPRSAIRRMYSQYQPPTANEKYHYTKILSVGKCREVE